MQQLLDNRYGFMRAGRARRGSGELRARRLVVGQTDGGRSLTLVVERTIDPTTRLSIGGGGAKVTLVVSVEGEDVERLERLAAARGQRPAEVVSALLRNS